MITRYLTNITLALIVGFPIMASQAFDPGSYSWLSSGPSGSLVH